MYEATEFSEIIAAGTNRTIMLMKAINYINTHDWASIRLHEVNNNVDYNEEKIIYNAYWCYTKRFNSPAIKTLYESYDGGEFVETYKVIEDGPE